MAGSKELVKALIRPLRPAASFLGQHGLLPKRLRQQLPATWKIGRFRIYGDGFSIQYEAIREDGIGHELFWTGLRKWEKETLNAFIPMASRARCLLDVGANGGVYSLVACAVNPSLRALAFEPLPDMFRALENNIALNGFAGRVSCHQKAAADFCGRTPFRINEDRSMSSLDLEGFQGMTGYNIEVEAVTLDSALEGEQDLDLVKIDVETFEPSVLRGMPRILTRSRPPIILECFSGDSALQIQEILAPLGYKFELLTDTGPQPKAELVPDPVYRNWLCTAVAPFKCST